MNRSITPKQLATGGICASIVMMVSALFPVTQLVGIGAYVNITHLGGIAWGLPLLGAIAFALSLWATNERIAFRTPALVVGVLSVVIALITYQAGSAHLAAFAQFSNQMTQSAKRFDQLRARMFGHEGNAAQAMEAEEEQTPDIETTPGLAIYLNVAASIMLIAAGTLPAGRTRKRARTPGPSPVTEVISRNP